MRLDIPTAIVSCILGFVMAGLLTMILVLSSGAEWGVAPADPKAELCYGLFVDYYDTEEGSGAEDTVWDAIWDASCLN